jgi:hypothetical protein
MAYRARFRDAIFSKEERIEEYRTAREAREAVAKFNEEGGLAEYLGRTPRKVDRSTVTFRSARRVERGIEVSAVFHAPKTTEGSGEYIVDLLIDPLSKGVIGRAFSLYNRKRGGYVDQYATAKQDEMAREIRDMFLKTRAWYVLKHREPDRFFNVSTEGEIIQVPGRKHEIKTP